MPPPVLILSVSHLHDTKQHPSVVGARCWCASRLKTPSSAPRVARAVFFPRRQLRLSASLDQIIEVILNPCEDSEYFQNELNWKNSPNSLFP